MMIALLRVFLLLALWPLWVLCLVLTMFVLSLAVQLPRIYGRHGFTYTATAAWLWLLLVVAVVAIATGTWMVMQAPWSNFPTSLEAPPLTMAGLYLAAYATAGWLVTTEVVGFLEGRRQDALLAAGENLDDYLGSWAA